MPSYYLVTSKNILYYGLYGGMQSRNEFEPGGKGFPGYPEGQSEGCLCYYVRFTTKDGLGHVASLSHIKYNLDLKALIFLYNLILDNFFAQ